MQAKKEQKEKTQSFIDFLKNQGKDLNGLRSVRLQVQLKYSEAETELSKAKARAERDAQNRAANSESGEYREPTRNNVYWQQSKVDQLFNMRDVVDRHIQAIQDLEAKTQAGIQKLDAELKQNPDWQLNFGAESLDNQTKTIAIKSGDTFNQIAKRYSITPSALQKLNPKISNPNQIKVGQKINVPQKKIDKKVANQERKANVEKWQKIKQKELVIPASTDVKKSNEYIIKPNDTKGLGAIVKDLTGEIDWGMTVEYLSNKLKE